MRCGGRGKQVASTLGESSVMVAELLLPPWADGRGREKEEEEGQGLTPIAGTPMDRDGIQRDVQVRCAAPHSFKRQLWEKEGDHPPCKLLCLRLPVSFLNSDGPALCPLCSLVLLPAPLPSPSSWIPMGVQGSALTLTRLGRTSPIGTVTAVGIQEGLWVLMCFQSRLGCFFLVSLSSSSLSWAPHDNPNMW